MSEEVDAASAALIARLMEEDARTVVTSSSPSVIPSDIEINANSIEISNKKDGLNTDGSGNGERRSKRVRRRPRRFEAGFASNFHNVDDGRGTTGGKYNGNSEKKEDRLKQVNCAEEDSSKAPFRVLIHPCARALMELHAHLAETEVIGYLGGSIVYEPDEKVVVYIAEAFPTRCVDEQELGRQGRDAFLEVEMEPESDVEVRTRVALKGLDIVGWYHSHPCFSCQPSTIDVENQRNYQNFIYKQKPYIAAIVGPYSEDHVDYRAEVVLFYVRETDGMPVRLDNEITGDRPAQCPGPYYTIDGAAKWHVSAFENEGMALISHYAEHNRRVELLAEWRDGVSVLEKLRMSLGAFTGNEAGSLVKPEINGEERKKSDENVGRKVTVSERTCEVILDREKSDSACNGNSECETVNGGDSGSHRGCDRDNMAMKCLSPTTTVPVSNGCTDVPRIPQTAKTLDAAITDLMSTAEDAWRRFQKTSTPKGPKRKKRKRRVVADD